MRNRLVHDYVNIDAVLVWRVLQDDLPGLIAILAANVPPEEEPDA
jgi:uncharacterized protein with HEPN domain